MQRKFEGNMIQVEKGPMDDLTAMVNGLSREVDGIHISRGEGPDVGQVEDEGSAVAGPESTLG